MRMFCRAIISRRWSASERKPKRRHLATIRATISRVLLVVRHLLFRHGHEVVLVEPLRQLLEHLLLRPADQDRREGPPDLVEVPVADDPAVLVHVLMLGEEPEHRSQAEAVDELHDRMQFLQAVLQGRAGQDDGVLGIEPS